MLKTVKTLDIQKITLTLPAGSAGLASYVPEPRHIKAMFDAAKELREKAVNEVEWFEQVNEMARNWLSLPLSNAN